MRYYLITYGVDAGQMHDLGEYITGEIARDLLQAAMLDGSDYAVIVQRPDTSSTKVTPLIAMAKHTVPNETVFDAIELASVILPIIDRENPPRSTLN